MKLKIFYALFIISSFCFCKVSSEEDADSKKTFQSVSKHIHPLPYSRLEVGYTAGKYIGAKRCYIELGGFWPAMLGDKWLSFADVRGYRFDNCKWGASAGLGLRTNIKNRGIVGANLFYDYMEGRINNGFNRLGIGAEWLSDCFDVRINGYLPLGRKTHSSLAVYSDFIGNYMLTVRDKESCVREGFDAEIGTSLVSWNNYKLYCAIGPYFFYHRRHKNFWGGQARIEFTWKTFFSLQIRTSYDSKYHTHTQARLLFSVPLDGICHYKSLTDIYTTSILQPVKRNGILFTQRSYSFTTNY
ncbi:Uncharacterized protein PHSC3_001787 [Chlamydiales bacterium STE3]|nr:Uncharacterized protein PHSC3_001787 [Chlamydiales bacterium STE3]